MTLPATVARAKNEVVVAAAVGAPEWERESERWRERERDRKPSLNPFEEQKPYMW